MRIKRRENKKHKPNENEEAATVKWMDALHSPNAFVSVCVCMLVEVNMRINNNTLKRE